MTIMLGNADTTNVRMGSTKVDKVMLGEQLVWPTETTTPFTLGAIHWLPFTNSPTEDIGTAPAVWNTYQSPTISDGALVSGRVRYPTNSTYDPANGSTVTGWVRNTATGIPYGDPPLSATASFSEISFWANSAGAARWRFRRGGAGAQTIIAGTVPDGWAFIAACMEPVSGTTWRYRAYINGTEALNNTYDAGTQHAVTFNSAEFRAASADISDAAIYNRALTASEVASLFADTVKIP